MVSRYPVPLIVYIHCKAFRAAIVSWGEQCDRQNVACRTGFDGVSFDVDGYSYWVMLVQKQKQRARRLLLILPA